MAIHVIGMFLVAITAIAVGLAVGLLLIFAHIVYKTWDMIILLIKCFRSAFVNLSTANKKSDDNLSSSFWSKHFTVHELRRTCLTYLGISINTIILSPSEKIDLYSLLFKQFGSDNNQYHKLKMIHTNLLYAATNRSFHVRQFNKLCVGHRNTLILLRNSYGNVIGGYLSVGIPKRSSFQLFNWSTDSESFLIRIRSNEKDLAPCVFRIKQEWKYTSPAISVFPYSVLMFGAGDLQISTRKFSYGIGAGSVCAADPVYGINHYEFSGGYHRMGSRCSTFEIEEIEVHQLNL